MSMLSSRKSWYSTRWPDEPVRQCGLTARVAASFTAAGRTMTQPQSATQEVLAGYVERVTYHNAENGFCVLRAKARGHRDVVTVVGHAASISAGGWVNCSGGGGKHRHPR